jgi:short-subunit dehydrogenase
MGAKMNFSGRWVLVTGASGGLGLEMAKQFARDHKANLILVARRLERLAALQKELEAAHGVQCRVIAADLSNAADVERVYQESIRQEVYGVVLNAGVTCFGRQLDIAWEAFQAMLATNVTSVVRLSTLFAAYLKERKQGGGIMLVGSIAGFLPVPYQSAYAASKAFVTHFGQGLYQELRGTGVSVTVFAPGGIATDMTNVGGLSYFKDSIFVQKVEACAKDGIGAMQSRRYLLVPGVLNRIQVFFARLAPRRVLSTIAEVTYRQALVAWEKENPPPMERA